MSGQEKEQAREKALYRYGSALQRGDFEAVAAALQEAEQDPALERMILEVNAVYRAEMEGTQTDAAQATRRPGDIRRPWPLARLFRRARDRRQEAGKRSRPNGNLIRRGLAVGAAALGLALVFAAGFALYTAPGYPGDVATSDAAFSTEAPPVAQLALRSPGRVPSISDGSYPALIPAQPPVDNAGFIEPYSVIQPTERMIIRQGSLALVVEDTRAARQEAEALVAGMAGEGAYVVSSQEYGAPDGSAPQISLNIRVPAARFGEAMDRLADLAVEVANRSESGQDVTEEYVDLEARVESLEAARQRLLEIMREAEKTRDVLDAEEQLTQREAEIESLKGRMQYLAQSAQLAAIWIELQPHRLSQPVDARWRPAETARDSLEALLNGLRNLGDFLIFFGIAVLPWMVVAGLVLYGVVRLALRRVRAGRMQREPEDAE